MERADRSKAYLPPLEKNRQSTVHTPEEYQPLRIHHSNMQGTSRGRSHRSKNVSDLLPPIRSHQSQWKRPSTRNENKRREWKREILYHHPLSPLTLLPFEYISGEDFQLFDTNSVWQRGVTRFNKTTQLAARAWPVPGGQSHVNAKDIKKNTHFSFASFLFLLFYVLI